MTGQNYELSLPDVPPSLNVVGSRGKSHWAFTNAKKKWEGMFFIALLESKVPKDLLSVDAEAVLTFPSKRVRDEGNFRMMLEKALGDIMVTGGWLPHGDSADFYYFRRVSFSEETGPKHTLVKLMVNP